MIGAERVDALTAVTVEDRDTLTAHAGDVKLVIPVKEHAVGPAHQRSALHPDFEFGLDGIAGLAPFGT